jgi:hypothetical protein
MRLMRPSNEKRSLRWRRILEIVSCRQPGEGEELLCRAAFRRSSSNASPTRMIAGCARFFIFSQLLEGPL